MSFTDALLALAMMKTVLSIVYIPLMMLLILLLIMKMRFLLLSVHVPIISLVSSSVIGVFVVLWVELDWFIGSNRPIIDIINDYVSLQGLFQKKMISLWVVSSMAS